MNITHSIPDEQTFESMPDFEISLADPAPTRRESNHGGTTASSSHVSKPRRGRRRGTGAHSVGSTASTEPHHESFGSQYHESFGSQSHDASASIGAISYESSECLFFDELASVADLDGADDDDDADDVDAINNKNGNSNTDEDDDDAIIDKEITLSDIVMPLAAPGERRTSFGRRGSGLSRANSSLSLKSVLEDEVFGDSDDDDDGNNVQPKMNQAVDTSKLALRRLEQRIVEKHIKTGRLRPVASMDQFGATSNADIAAGQRRIRTSLSFGSNMSRLSLATSSSNNFIDQPSQQGGGLRRTSLQKNDSFRSLRSGASDKSAASAGHRLLGL